MTSDTRCLQTLGGMIGPIVTGIILATSQVSTMYQGEIWQVPDTGTYHQVFLAVIIISSILLVISWVCVQDRRGGRYGRDTHSLM